MPAGNLDEMGQETMRERLDAAWAHIDSAAVSSKNSPRAVHDLIAVYASISAEDRDDADEVLAQWATGDDESKRFDALALIDHFKVVSAMPSLRDLAQRLEDSEAPSAPYDWAKVNRIIGSLSAP